MSNPILNDTRFNKIRQQHAGEAGWGAGGSLANPTANSTWAPPITDGPTSKHHSGRMTVNGVASAGMMLFALLLISAAVGWTAVAAPQTGTLSLPPMAWIGMIIGFVAVIIASFKPMNAHILGPIYAVGQGLFVGAISKIFNTVYPGIVVPAVGATLAVFGVMLFLYRTRILQVTNKFRRVVIGATLGVMVFYFASFIFGILGGNTSFLSSSSGLGILFSLFVAGLAAFNLALDFDYIERSAKIGLPRRMEWFAALGLLVTLVWLYLEILRLLAKLRNR